MAGLRRLDSEDIPDTSKVTARAQAVATRRCDTALEKIVGGLSLEPNVSAATWQIDCSIPEGQAEELQVQQENAIYFDKLALGARRPFPFRQDLPAHAAGSRHAPGAAATVSEPWTVPTTTPSQRHAK